MKRHGLKKKLSISVKTPSTKLNVVILGESTGLTRNEINRVVKSIGSSVCANMRNVPYLKLEIADCVIK